LGIHPDHRSGAEGHGHCGADSTRWLRGEGAAETGPNQGSLARGNPRSYRSVRTRQTSREKQTSRLADAATLIMAKILVVEDNEMNRDMLTRRLQRRGYEVVTAVDGAQGLAMAQSERPALILMDISLPVLDGWEATRRLKMVPETKSIPVVALTAHAMSGDRERCIDAGCDDFDTKPVEIARLVGKIETLLNRSKAQ